MQQALFDTLVEGHGPENVSAEQQTCSGRPADLMVQTEDGYEIYEIKTSQAPRDCVREALGQLLEYAYWPRSPPALSVVVVGPNPIDAQTQEYVDRLGNKFGLPLNT